MFAHQTFESAAFARAVGDGGVSFGAVGNFPGFADDFAGSVASVGVNATATFVLDVLREGVSVGSISISTSGDATFSTTGGTVSFASGETIEIVGPVTIDDTIRKVAVTLMGTIDG